MGKSIYSTYFLLVLMGVVPTAVFTDIIWLDQLAWGLGIILGVFILITGVVILKDARDSSSWPKIEAVLKSASTTYHTTNASKSYVPRITCEFTVDGIKYTGTEYDFSSSYTRKELVMKKIAEVKNANPLLVRYKPSDPSINVIHSGVHSVHFIRMIFGAALIVVPVLSLLEVITYK